MKPRFALAAVLALCAAVPFAAPAVLGGDEPAGIDRTHSFDAATVALLEGLPVQEDGRIKPLGTLAGFHLLAMNGKRSHLTPDGGKLGSTEWLLDGLFHPGHAETQKVFRIENDEILDTLRIEHEGRDRSDRYAYFELRDARGRLDELAQQYAHVDAKQRSPVQGGVLKLSASVNDFVGIRVYLDCVRYRYPIPASPALRDLFGGNVEVRLSDVLRNAKALHALRRTVDPSADGGADSPAADLIEGMDSLLRDVSQQTWTSRSLALFPPGGTQKASPTWMSVFELTEAAFLTDAPVGSQIELLAALERMTDAADDPAAFHTAALTLHEGVTALADSRGEASGVALEVSYYRADFFFWSLLAFVLSFILVALSWAWPRSKVLRYGISTSMVVAVVLVSVGITYRCVIRNRPPVTTLYETILFITATGVLGLLVTELINRRRIALSTASVVGTLGMFLAQRYELNEARDTMPNLQAVLDTNFWLSTHVTSVTIGYSAGLIASAVAHVYLLRRFWELIPGRRGTLDRTFDKGLARTTYGLICFGLLFSVVGTILGGIWANDSWGRFWGWDPKENGALMICLWELIILHARMGGYIKDFGLAMAAVFGGIVVGFSWWGVNFLGVGLHTYGFIEGVGLALTIFYGSQYIVLGAGGVAWLVARRSTAAHAAGDTPLPPVPPA